MRFSILLPTRDRPELLRLAVATVQRQRYDNWEIVIADNGTHHDVAALVDGWADPRIVYLPPAGALDVTANWNRALDASRGEYVLMLGDDDGLTPGYFEETDALLQTFDDPDAVYTRALLFAYPGVMPFEPRGYTHVAGCADFFARSERPFLLDASTRRFHVEQAMAFHQTFDFNMQYLLVGRPLIERLAPRGAFFQSAFPDYFATPAVFLTARRVVVDPEPRTIIGVTPKSYGFYHFNDRHAEGGALLEGADSRDWRGTAGATRLPGSGLNDGWLSAMERLSEVYGDVVQTRVDLGRYRLLQAIVLCERRWLLGDAGEGQTSTQWRELLRRSGRRERVLFRALYAAYASREQLPTRAQQRFDRVRARAVRALRQHPEVFVDKQVGGHDDLLSLFTALEADRGAA